MSGVLSAGDTVVVIKDLNVNTVVSFDYQKKRNELLSNKKANYYSILTKNGKYGKLRLEFNKGKILESWEEVEFSY